MHDAEKLSTPVQKFTNVFSAFSSSQLFVGRELGEKRGEVSFGELPFEGPGRCFPVVLEVEQAFCQLVQAGEVVRGKDFSLHDGEVDLDLIEPTGMDWTMNEGQARELPLESRDGSLATVRTPIVNDPKDTPGFVVGRASHDLLNKAIKGCDTSGCFAAAKDTGTMNVESCEIGPGSATTILMFDAHRALRRDRQSWMLAPPGLDAGLLVGGDDKFITFEGFGFPAALIQIQNSVGLDGEGGVPREDPTAVVPRANGVFMEPPPNGTSRDGGNQTGMADLTGNVRGVAVGERNAMSGW